MEKLQERALCIIYKDKTSSYDMLLEKVDVLPLSIIRLKYLAVETFKCIRGYNPKYLNDLFLIKEGTKSCIKRSGHSNSKEI